MLHFPHCCYWLGVTYDCANLRLLSGEELLPEEDPTLFKPVPEPNLLDNYLVTNQISTFCDQLNTASMGTIEKLYVADALQKGALWRVHSCEQRWLFMLCLLCRLISPWTWNVKLVLLALLVDQGFEATFLPHCKWYAETASISCFSPLIRKRQEAVSIATFWRHVSIEI